MKCPLEDRENREILLAYGSRARNGSDTELESHLQTCPACREFVRGQRAVWQALEEWEAEPVSADFDRRLFARIERETPWWRRAGGFRLVLFRALPITAAAALAVVGVVLEWPTPHRVQPRPPAAQVEGLRPDEVVQALDEMEVLNQFNRSIKADSAAPRM